MTTLNLSTSEASAESTGGSNALGWNHLNIDTTTELGGCRWTGFTIPSGATISTAVLKLTVLNGVNDEPNHPVWLEDAASPAALDTSTNGLENRAETTAQITWSSTDLGAISNTEFSLPDNTASVQELVDSYGDISVIVMILRGSSSSTRDLQLSNVGSYPAKYDITYTGGATARTPRMPLLGVG